MLMEGHVTIKNYTKIYIVVNHFNFHLSKIDFLKVSFRIIYILFYLYLLLTYYHDIYSKLPVNITDPLPLIEKSRASCPGGRFPPSFIHQVIIITRLNKLYDCMFPP